MNIILHSDLNNFYASVECLNKPELKNKPVVVGGSQQDRHGVVLAKNQTAKLLGIKTGMTIHQAKSICPNLISFLPNFQKYVSYSKRVKNIYKKFTDKLESFGIDECWLDITNSIKLFGSPIEIAKKIQESVFLETGLTVSIGISYNKAFSKLGSDLKKPNGITIITPENYQNLVWPRPIQDLLGVGKQTALKLNQMGIHTIGELAKTNIDLLKSKLGKNGSLLHQKANGNDLSSVECNNICKSIGNSLTYYKDIKTFEEAKSLLILLAESVAARLIEENLGYATIVHLSITENDLFSYSRQIKIEPSILANDFLHAAIKLLKSTHDSRKFIRALGISISGFQKQQQSTIFFQIKKRNELIQKTIETIRQKFGRTSINRAQILMDSKLIKLNIKDEHNLDSKNI